VKITFITDEVTQSFEQAVSFADITSEIIADGCQIHVIELNGGLK